MPTGAIFQTENSFHIVRPPPSWSEQSVWYRRRYPANFPQWCESIWLNIVCDYWNVRIFALTVVMLAMLLFYGLTEGIGALCAMLVKHAA